MFGGDGADDLDPGGGGDFVRGGGGDDYVTGGGGDDNYHGGAGDDSVDYHASAAAVTVDLAAGTGAGADIGADRLASIESAFGGAGDDSLAGELRDGADGADGRLQADTDGDGVADFEILLSGALAPLATDFI
jgi:hypothetical protein